MVGPPIYRYRRRPPNMLPVDSKTGGQPLMIGWYETSPLDNTRGPGWVRIIPGEFMCTSTKSLLSGVPSYSNPLKVTPGRTYTAAITMDAGSMGLVWLTEGNTDFQPPQGVGATQVAPGRFAATGVAPPGAAGAVIYLEAPTVAATFSSPVFVQSTVDPGPLPPLPDPLLVGDRLYQSLPEMYRTADATAAGPGQTPQPLYQLLKAVGEQADWPLYYADRLTNRELTNPVLADDAWIPWLAQAVGITQSNSTTAVADMRAGIVGKQQAAQPGTAAAVVALVRTWLTGTKVCNIVPTPTAWTIAVQVRADEMNGMTSATLKARILATGLVPAGFTLNISNALPTWDQIDAAFGATWDAKDRNFPLWQDIDSYGVT